MDGRDTSQAPTATTGLDSAIGLDDLPPAGETVDLARRAKAGDQDALNELLERHQAWLRRVIRIKLGGPAVRVRRFYDSLDIAQEVMGVVMNKIGRLDARTAAGVRRWLAQIATYEINDCLKYADAEIRNPDREVRLQTARAPHSSAPPEEVSSGQPRPEERAAKEELRQILDDAVSELPLHYQEVVLLRDYAREDWEEIRQKLRKETTGAAKQLYHRAWIKIRDIAAPRLRNDSPD